MNYMFPIYNHLQKFLLYFKYLIKAGWKFLRITNFFSNFFSHHCTSFFEKIASRRNIIKYFWPLLLLVCLCMIVDFSGIKIEFEYWFLILLFNKTKFGNVYIFHRYVVHRVTRFITRLV